MSSGPMQFDAGSADSSKVFRSLGVLDARLPVGTFLFSIYLHVMLVGFLVLAPIAFMPPKLKLANPQQLLDDGSHRLVWYRYSKELPAVSPAKPVKPAEKEKPPRIQSEQKIQASAPEATSNRQMVWGAPPEIELQQDVESPNLLALSLPELPRERFNIEEAAKKSPERRRLEADEAPEVKPQAPKLAVNEAESLPKMRFDQEQRNQATPDRQALDAAPAPAIDPLAAARADLPQSQPLPRIRYETDAAQQDMPSRAALSAQAGPELAGVNLPKLEVAQALPLPRIRYQALQSASASPRAQSLDSGAPAPRVASSSSPRREVLYAPPLPSMRYRDWDGARPPTPGKRALDSDSEAPAVRAATTRAASEPGLSPPAPANLPAPPPQPSSEGDGDGLFDPSAPPTEGSDNVQMAVVGVNPSANDPAVPMGNRSAQFSAGPNAVPSGADDAAVVDPGSGLSIPNLSIEGEPAKNLTRDAIVNREPPRDVKKETEILLARAARSPNLREMTSFAPPEVNPNAKPAKMNLDLPFGAKPMYKMAVNLPNISSHSGSWEFRFAELNPEKAANGEELPKDLSFPTPIFKVDPKYLASAVEDQIEGEVVLHAIIRRDGNVDTVTVVKSLDERLDQSAVEAMAKWRFVPATRMRLPIDLETVVTIPFKLSPLPDK